MKFAEKDGFKNVQHWLTSEENIDAPVSMLFPDYVPENVPALKHSA
jgi:hypothetical protein